MTKTSASGWVIAILVFIAGCSSPKPGFEDYEFETQGGESVAAELGTILVPENRSDPASRQIPLRFVRFRSTSENPGSPIVYLAGGPGGSGIDAARGSRFPLFMAMREFGDVIAFDQRGTGMSGFDELDCDDRYQYPFDQPIEPRLAGEVIAEVTRACIDRMREDGIDVNAYNTIESAADLMDLRRFLGTEKISLWGISYGTHLSLATIKYHGEHVDRAILAGVEGLHHTWKLPADQQALLEEIARLAAADPAVSKVMPDLLASIEQLLEQLDAEPVAVRLGHPQLDAEVEVVVGRFDLQFVIASALTGPETFSGLPDAIYRIENGDWMLLALGSSQGRVGEGLHGMSTAMDCASGASDAWNRRIAEEAKDTLLGDAINRPFSDVCELLDVPDLGDDFRSAVVSDVPVLLISGTLDGRTPPANAEEVMPGLGNVQHLVIDGAGHSDPLFVSSPQILEVMQAFMRDDELPTTRITLPAPEFIVPRTIADLDGETLARYVGSYEIENGGGTRDVIKAGNLLYTKRGRGQALPIRPTSETAFFYEGSLTHLEFQTDPDGNPTGMIMYHDGASEGEFAEKE